MHSASSFLDGNITPIPLISFQKNIKESSVKQSQKDFFETLYQTSQRALGVFNLDQKFLRQNLFFSLL